MTFKQITKHSSWDNKGYEYGLLTIKVPDGINQIRTKLATVDLEKLNHKDAEKLARNIVMTLKDENSGLWNMVFNLKDPETKAVYEYFITLYQEISKEKGEEKKPELLFKPE